MTSPVSIIGAGPAGLATAYFAKKRRIPFEIFEASDEAGGNARTLRHEDFLIDTGAHRFHDRYPEITSEIKALLGQDLIETAAPSQIVSRGKFIDFPLSPLNLLRNFGLIESIKSATNFVRAKSHKLSKSPSFEEIAIHRYGESIAHAFLLGYSEKLWGLPASRLSPAVSGKRLRGLNLRTFVIEAFQGKRSKTAHLDGSFLYPRFGIGQIMNTLADSCGREHIQFNSRVTRVFHSGSRITGFEINEHETTAANQIVSTLPLSLLINTLDPKPPQAILDTANRLEFRHLILVALFFNQERITRNASLYFPDPEVPFTRAYEPKNRSAATTPAKQTSFVVEIPCNNKDSIWKSSDSALRKIVLEGLARYDLVDADRLIDFSIYRIPFAYPVLEKGFESLLSCLHTYLEEFENLNMLGRSASFEYTHIHDLLKAGRDLADKLSGEVHEEDTSAITSSARAVFADVKSK